MGLNTKHQCSGDLASGYNVTKKKSFKFEPTSEKECRSFEISQGLEFQSISILIKLNRGSNIDVKDKITIFGKTYMVERVASSFSNNLEFRKSTNYDNFAGAMLVGLK